MNYIYRTFDTGPDGEKLIKVEHRQIINGKKHTSTRYEDENGNEFPKD